MADFCRDCTRDLLGADANDVGQGWDLCEGCGLHYFDVRGRRLCRRPLPAEQDITGDPCTDCQAADSLTRPDPDFQDDHPEDPHVQAGLANAAGMPDDDDWWPER